MRRSILLPTVALFILLPSPSFTAAQHPPNGSPLTPAQQLAIASECKASEAVASKEEAEIDSALICVQDKVAQINETNQKKIAQLQSLLGSALQLPAEDPSRPVPSQQTATQPAYPQQAPQVADPDPPPVAAPKKPAAAAPVPKANKAATPETIKITAYSGSGFYLDLGPVIGSNVPTCPCRFKPSDDMPPGLQFDTSPGNEPILSGTPSTGDKDSYVIKTVAIVGVDDILMVPVTIDVMRNDAKPVPIGGANPVALPVSGFNGEPYSASFTLKDVAGKACPSIVTVDSQTIADLKTNQKLALTIQGATGTLKADNLVMTPPITFPVACKAGGPTATISIAPYKTPASQAVAAAAPNAKIMFAEPLAMPVVEGASEIKGQVLNIPAAVLPLTAQLWITAPGAQTPALLTLKSGGTSATLAADGTYDLQLASPLVGGSKVLVQLVSAAGVTLTLDKGNTPFPLPIDSAIKLNSPLNLNITSEIIPPSTGSSSTITGTVTMPEFGVAPTATPASYGNYPQISVWTKDPVTGEWSIAQLTTTTGTAPSLPVGDAYGNFSVVLKTPLAVGQRVRVLAISPPGRTFNDASLQVLPIPPAEIGAYPLVYETTVPAPLLMVRPTVSNPALLVERATTLSGLATPTTTATTINVAVVKLGRDDQNGLGRCLTADKLDLPNPEDSILSISASPVNSLFSPTAATTGTYSVILAMPLNRTDRIQIVQVLPAGIRLPAKQQNKCNSDVLTVRPPYTWESHDGTQTQDRTNNYDATKKNKKPYSSPCTFNFNDCDFKYSVIGGVEQADLSAQSSVTEGFYYLYIRSPYNMRWGNLWFTSRYLGAPSSSSTQNVVAAAASPSTTLSASNLPQSVASIDYKIGVERDFFQPTLENPGSGQWTIGAILSFGATSPLSANTAVTGFTVPDFGTNECNQLLSRFVAKMGYNPALPPSGYYNSAGPAATPVSSATEGCIVQPQNGYSSGTMANPGTQVTTIAFSNEDRSSFLLKYDFGLRFIHRTLAPNTTHCSPYGSGDDSTGGLCRRLLADLTIGQDQAITGGYLRRFVFKGDTVVPVLNTGAYFFASSATRLTRNLTLSPLVLPSQTVGISNSTSTCTPSATNVCLPSDNIFILPFKQANRDFYRIGIGIDLTTVLKIFTGAASQ